MIKAIKNNNIRASQAILILRVIILFDVIMIVFDILELDLFLRLTNDEPVSDLSLKRNEIRQYLISIFYTTVSFCSGLAFLGWLYRAYANVSRTGIQSTHLNPAWSIWAFLIPVINLFMPLRIILEIREKNNSSIVKLGGKIETGKSWVIPLWWILWLISILSSLVYIIILFVPHVKPHRPGLSGFAILSDFSDIPAAMMAIWMIRQINSTERELFKLINKSG